MPAAAYNRSLQKRIVINSRAGEVVEKQWICLRPRSSLGICAMELSVGGLMADAIKYKAMQVIFKVVFY
jgi:hypothetical protein